MKGKRAAPEGPVARDLSWQIWRWPLNIHHYIKLCIFPFIITRIM